MTPRTVYLVDTENVGSNWTSLLEHKNNNDRILLFFTDNSPHISYTDLEIICRYPNAFEMIRCNTGRNALDFQLVSYAGYLMKSAPKTRYIILSNDTGYDAMIQFWVANHGMKLSRMNVSDLKPKKYELISYHSAIQTLVEQEAVPKEDVKMINDILVKEDTIDLRDIHNDLVKTFGMDYGSQLYKIIKPILSKIK